MSKTLKANSAAAEAAQYPAPKAVAEVDALADAHIDAHVDALVDALPEMPQDFESALAQLEALVVKMESGALPLEESLAAYRRGVSLTRVCQARLAQAEQQISVLEAGLLRPFDDSDRRAE